VNLLVLLCIGLSAALLAFITNWLALIPWRRAKGLHWTERARVYHPVRVSAASNLWVLPGVASLSVLLLFPNDGPNWALVAVAASIGTLIGTIPMDLEVWPRFKPGEIWRLVVKGWLMRFLTWFVFLGAAALMPEYFGFETILIFVVVLALLIWWNGTGWLKVGQWLGTKVSPPERLVNIVKNTAAKMNVACGEVWFVRAHSAQAFAHPARRALLFTERFAEILTDDEISAVCAHELAHLTEARSDYYKRYIVWLTFLPWLFTRPVIHNFGVFGFYFLMGFTMLTPYIFRRVSHKLETRADAIAHANEPDPGTYARALAKLYEDNLVPAVNSKKRATHPHLYDRLLAAGVTPDFPRPRPPDPVSWNGLIFSMALGALAALLVFRTTGLFSVSP
jgi:Zn-dependent protease with chaperone function